MGFFGGSFDPPHKGHLAVAQAAAVAFGLDVVLVAPTGKQPLKVVGARASFADRMAMVGLACAEDWRLRASGVDGPREDGGANYTVDALGRVRAEWPGAEVFGIVGMDAFRQMGEWREPERVRSMVDWVVVTRPGFSGEDVSEPGVRLLETVWVNVSATRLRKRLAAGEDCSEWVGEAVMRYIRERGLYRADALV